MWNLGYFCKTLLHIISEFNGAKNVTKQKRITDHLGTTKVRH